MISPDQLRVLVALRDATALQRKPANGPLDGHSHWFTLADLMAEGRLEGGDGVFVPPALCAAARSLRKTTLYVAGKRMHTHDYYGISQAGIDYLAELEAEAGVTEVVRTQQLLEQAKTDEDRAEAAYNAAVDALQAAHQRTRIRRKLAKQEREALAAPVIDLLLDTLKAGER
jgi:hypothetical protein